MQVVINVEERRLAWDPTRSTPSCPHPMAELERIAEEFVARKTRSVIDFGAGRGRHTCTLAAHLGTVTAVELEKNIPALKEGVEQCKRRGLTVWTAGQFGESKRKYDGALIAFVLHTIPREDMRTALLDTLASKLRGKGTLVAVVPGGDSKYRAKFRDGMRQYGDGWIRLYPNDTFSFYKNYTAAEFDAFLQSSGWLVLKRIRGDHRYIRLCEKS